MTVTGQPQGLKTYQVKLLPVSVAALEAAAKRTRDSQTTTINRAIRFYDHATKLWTVQRVLRRVVVIAGFVVPLQWVLFSHLPLDSWWEFGLVLGSVIGLPLIVRWVDWTPR